LARIAGINIPKEKRFVIALTYIYGIGRTSAEKICNKLAIDAKLRTHQIPEEKLAQVRVFLEKNFPTLEGDLRRKNASNIKRLIDINSFRGRRHLKGLPVRGQRTRTNNRTSRRQGLFIRKK
jgi:small subunit ribosomal protein S13